MPALLEWLGLALALGLPGLVPALLGPFRLALALGLLALALGLLGLVPALLPRLALALGGLPHSLHWRTWCLHCS